MTDTLRDFVEHASKSIERVFKTTGIVRPMWHAICRDGEEMIFPAPHPDKDTATGMVRALFELRDVTRYAFIDEAWMVAAFGPDATPEQLRAVREAAITGATASPHREEIVMIAAEDHVEGSLMARRRIIRRQDGRAKLGILEFDPRGGMVTGRFLGLLPRKSAAVH